MKKKKNLIIATGLLLFLTSCITDYKGEIPLPANPQVVVSSIISPDKPISVILRWSKPENEDDYFEQVKNAAIRIWEDGELIIDETCEKGKLNSELFPKHGSKYELKVTVPNYGDVTASTSIPETPAGNMSFKEIRRNEVDSECYIFVNVSGMRLNSSLRALWLVANVEYERKDNIESMTPVFHYPDTYEIDQVNIIINSLNSAYSGTVVECEGFIRIPQDIVVKKEWINFSFVAEGWLFSTSSFSGVEGGEKELKLSYITQLAVDFIAPSDEYDRYCRSIYKQYYFRYDPDTPFLKENVNVQSNVKNGLGVFAGCAVHRAAMTVDKKFYYEP